MLAPADVRASSTGRVNLGRAVDTLNCESEENKATRAHRTDYNKRWELHREPWKLQRVLLKCSASYNQHICVQRALILGKESPKKIGENHAQYSHWAGKGAASTIWTGKEPDSQSTG